MIKKAALSALTAMASETRTPARKRTYNITRQASLPTSSRSATMRFSSSRDGHVAGHIATSEIRRSRVASAISTKYLYVNSK